MAAVYEWDFEEIVGLRDVVAVAADSTSGPAGGTGVYAVSDSLAALVQLRSMEIGGFESGEGMVDAVGQVFARLAYVEVRFRK